MLVASNTMSMVTGTGDSIGGDVWIWGVGMTFGATGSLIAARHPGNPIGWLCLVVSVFAGLSNLADSWAEYYIDSRSGPALLAEAAAEYNELAWMVYILLPATFLLALFPDGHLLSRRWRPVAWCSAVGFGGGFVAQAMIAGPIPSHPELTNPFGVNHPMIDPLTGLMLLLSGIGMIGGSVSLVLRFRRSHGEQRQQIKWLAMAGVVAAVTIGIAIPAYGKLGEDLANAVIMLSLMGLPTAAAIAILRYRLYDIDVVINRALVYGTLTATLAGIYLVSVLLLQLALESFTQGSGLAVAASTLAAAALIRPARARIQAIVDRRFFRRKYDAAQTLAIFSARLRDQVDLADIGDKLLVAVGDTVQPSHASLWLREPEATR
jgi:hypothetical protein